MNFKFSQSKPLKYVIVLINFVFGAFLWLSYFTNYSFVGKYSDFLFPPIIGLVGFASYKFLTKKNSDNRKKLFYKLANAPSIVGGILSLVMLIPPVCLLSFMLLHNSSQEKNIQQEISPNNLQKAYVYHGYAGMVDADDIYSIRIRPRWFPMIEKEVYSILLASPSWCINASSNCIYWIDNSTIYISETMQEIKTDQIEFSAPAWLAEIIVALSWLPSK